MKKPIALLIAGIVLLLGPLWGLLGTVLGMTRAFSHVDQAGSETPEMLATDVGLALWTTVIGLLVTPIGLGLVVIGIVWMTKIKQRQRNDPAG